MQSLARPKLNSAYFLLMLCLGTPSMEKSFDDEKSMSSEDLLSKTLSALERAVAFYSKDYDKVNLDTIFGLRMCQGKTNRFIMCNKICKRDNVLIS